MKLKVSDIKLFKSNASSIKSRATMPILSYLKFGSGKVTKNMLNEFIVHEMEGADEDVLVDEKVLFSFAENTSSKEIEITKDGKTIKITDGEIHQMCPTDDYSLYPVNRQQEGSIYHMDDKMINSISMASRFIRDEGDTPEPVHFVYVGNGYVVGQNGAIGYSEEINGKTPNIMLPKKISNMVSKFSECNYSETDSYMFFDVGVCRYGYSKSMLRFSDRTAFAKMSINELPSFKVKVSDIRRFNDLCISSRKGFYSVCSMSVKDVLRLESIDSDHEMNTSRELDIESSGKISDTFHYNPEMMNILLKSIEEEFITFHQDKKTHCFITGETGFRSLLMGMQ